MNKKERSRLENSLVVICGLHHTFEQWTRVLLPFTQWSLYPRPNFQDILKLNALSAFMVMLGTFVMAQLIESQGLRRTGIIISLVTAIYQLLITQIHHFWGYCLLQTLLFFNHMPMIIDSCVVHMEDQDGDHKKRSIFLNRLTIPMSIGTALGPYLAIQFVFKLSADLVVAQTTGAILNVIGNIVLVVLYIPDTRNTNKSLRLPSFSSYKQILANPKTKWCILLLMMVVGPYSAYEQVVRISLSTTVANDPNELAKLFLLMGIACIIANIWLVPYLQSKVGVQKMLAGTFFMLACSYIYLSIITSHEGLYIGMPLQVVALSICFGELSSQILSTVGKHDGGKGAALIRMSFMTSLVMVPVLTGYHVDKDEATALCYISAVISLLAIPVVVKFCGFMRSHTATLPLGVGKLE